MRKIKSVKKRSLSHSKKKKKKKANLRVTEVLFEFQITFQI